MEPVPQPAREDHVPAIRTLLEAEELYLDELERHARTLLVALEGERVVAAGGLELRGTDGLLRSIVVAPSHRGRGLGRELLAGLVRLAREHDLATLWGLTLDAEPYFARLGLRTVPRASVPPSVAASPMFTGALCATATCMRLDVATFEP